MITVIVRPVGTGGLFEARVLAQILVAASSQPFVDAARVLAPKFCASEALVMRHAGCDHDALRSTIGAAAKLTVSEAHGTRFERWKPFSRSAVAPLVRFAREAVQ